jgi:hypothetical protein
MASPREVCLTGRRIGYLVNIARRQGDREMAQPFPHCAGPLESTRTGGPTPWMPVVKATGRRGKSNSSTVVRASRPRVPIHRGTGVPPVGSQAPWYERPTPGSPSTVARASRPWVPKPRGTGVPPEGSQAPWYERPARGFPSTLVRASRPRVPIHRGTGVPPQGPQALWHGRPAPGSPSTVARASRPWVPKPRGC